MDKPDAPPEAVLIERAREAMTPRMSVRKAANRAGISEGRWRQIAKGYQQVTKDIVAPAIAPDQTLAYMAEAVGVTPEDLAAAGRMGAAQILIGITDDHEIVTDQIDIRRRGGPDGSVVIEVDDHLGGGWISTAYAVAAVQRKLLAGEPTTPGERAALREALDQQALATLSDRIKQLTTSEQLIVSEFVDEMLGEAAEFKKAREWVDDHQTQEPGQKAAGPEHGGKDSGGGAPIVPTELQHRLDPRTAGKGDTQGDFDLANDAGVNRGKELRRKWDSEHEHDAIDPEGPETGA